MGGEQPAGVVDNSFGFPVDTALMFSDSKGKYRKRIEKRQRALLGKLPDLGRFLEPGEQVFLVATGCSPVGFLEWYTSGWVVYYLKRCLFVFTDKRIFHIPTTRSFQYRNSIAEIRFADCESITMWGNRLKIKYKSGKKESFGYIPWKYRRRIRGLIDEISYEGRPSEAQERTYLCPRCTKPLKRGNYICPSCRLRFKSPDEGRNISIIYPGGGYFYTGHPLLGISDAFVEVILIVLVAVAIAGLVNGAPDAGGQLLLFGFFLVLEKLISVYHSHHFIKEYIPEERNIVPAADT